MADSLLFDGVDDRITVGNGGVGAFGPGMVGVIIKFGATSAEQKIFAPHINYAYLKTSGDSIGIYGGGSILTGQTLTDDIWYLCICNKPAGTLTPRHHVYNYNTSSWNHTDGSGTVGDISAPGSQILIGSGSGGADGWVVGNFLIGGFWNSSPANDAAVEALQLEQGYAKWIASNPVEAWRFSSMSTISAFGTTGTADEISRVGTSVDTGDVPAGWDDSTVAAQKIRPDADTTTTGWTATPLFSKINDESDATVITATAS